MSGMTKEQLKDYRENCPNSMVRDFIDTIDALKQELAEAKEYALKCDELRWKAEQSKPDNLGGYPDRCVHSRSLDVPCASCGRLDA